MQTAISSPAGSIEDQINLAKQKIEALSNYTTGISGPKINISETLTSLIGEYDFRPIIEVEYQTDSVVALKADEVQVLNANGSMAPFWNAIDIVQHLGYRLDDIVTSGVGSEGNPTRFFAIFSKP